MTSATANEATPHNPFIGRVMGGRYQVDRLIGRGGMGLVYLGRELPSDRELVLKMLAPHWAEEPTAVARFEREGKRLSELRHPHIVELFDIGHEADNPYIVMEFIRGVPLRKVLNANGRLTEAEFLPIAAQLLEAVAYAHGKGVMLRDIKPSNVMLCEHEGKANYVKVLDFGLAKMVDGDDVEVTKSNVIGTAGFLAPELIRGGEIDVRVDIYALSIMFFIMLTGSSPVRGENDGAILYNHVHGEPRPFAEALPEGEEVSKALQDLIYKGMAKEATDRQADAAQMLEELRRVAEPDAFELPDCTPEAKKKIERYWARKFEGRGLSDKEPSSSLWTRPRLEKLLEGDADEAEEVEASDEDPYGTSPGAPLRPAPTTGGHNLVDTELGSPRSMPPQPSAAIRAKTTGRLPAATQMGLPAFSTDSVEPPLPPPNARRPKPARTVASSNMERALPGPPPRRRTLLGPQGPQDSTGASEPAANGKATQPPSMPASMLAPMPLEAPSPLDGDNDVGPLHLELQVPTGRGSARPAGKRSTIPMGSAAAIEERAIEERATDELDVLELDEIEIDVEDEAEADVGSAEPELEPITDPVAPVTRPAPDLSAAAPSLPLMAEAEHAPPKRGLGVVLAVAVGAALALGGVVTWLALRSGDAPVAQEAAASAPALEEAEPPAQASRAPSEDLVVVTDDGLDIDPDAPGMIRVEGPEGAEAFINDESVGTVPAEVSRGPGLYEIRVVAKGYEDWSTEVQLQPDGHAKLVATSAAKDEPERAKTSARRKRPSGGTRPSGGPAKPESEPKPAAEAEPKPEPKPEPPPKKTPPPEDEDDVFMKRGEKKDDGIFLPVGK